MELDQATARLLLQEGATFVFLGVPEETEFGIDMQSWNTAENFRGIKMIPPGIHFIHFSAVSKSSGDISPRSGFMYNFKKKDFIVKMWDKKLEDISVEEVSEESVQRLRDNLYNLDRFLAPYPYEIWHKWKSLSNHLTEELILRLSPEKGLIRSSVELLSTEDKDRPRGNKIKIEELPSSSADSTNKPDDCESCDQPKKQRYSSMEEFERALLPDLKPAPGTGLRFTEIPKDRHPPNATPQEITKHNLDQSYTLEVLLSKHENPIDIIGELQFAYICFLIGHSLDSFDHWKNLIDLLCSCEEALHKYKDVYLNFINVLEIQLYEMPEEFLTDIVMNNNLVYKKLRDLFKTAYISNVDSRFLSSIEVMKKNLTDKFEWDFSDLEKDEDDEKPVIVQIN